MARNPDGHYDWCHIYLDCCGCGCRDAYTDYYEQVRRGPRTEHGDGEMDRLRLPVDD